MPTGRAEVPTHADLVAIWTRVHRWPEHDLDAVPDLPAEAREVMLNVGLPVGMAWCDFEPQTPRLSEGRVCIGAVWYQRPVTIDVSSGAVYVGEGGDYDWFANSSLVLFLQFLFQTIQGWAEDDESLSDDERAQIVDREYLALRPLDPRAFEQSESVWSLYFEESYMNLSSFDQPDRKPPAIDGL